MTSKASLIINIDKQSKSNKSWRAEQVRIAISEEQYRRAEQVGSNLTRGASQDIHWRQAEQVTSKIQNSDSVEVFLMGSSTVDSEIRKMFRLWYVVREE